MHHLSKIIDTKKQSVVKMTSHLVWYLIKILLSQEFWAEALFQQLSQDPNKSIIRLTILSIKVIFSDLERQLGPKTLKRSIQILIVIKWWNTTVPSQWFMVAHFTTISQVDRNLKLIKLEEFMSYEWPDSKTQSSNKGIPWNQRTCKMKANSKR